MQSSSNRRSSLRRAYRATASPSDRRDVPPNLSRTEKPLRYDRMSGLDAEQLDELVQRIEDQLEEPWHKGIGRPKDLTLREAVVVTCRYMRQNIIQEVWAEIFAFLQSCDRAGERSSPDPGDSPGCPRDLA